MKRSPAYRRYRCHLADTCPQDAWTDGAREGFALFGLRGAGRPLTHLVFAVDRRRGEVTSVRALLLRDDAVTGVDPARLPPCPRAGDGPLAAGGAIVTPVGGWGPEGKGPWMRGVAG